MAESSGNAVAGGHNLDLSLGNSSSKHSNSTQAPLGNHNPNAATDQQYLPPESNWRNNGGSKPKVRVVYNNVL